MKAKTQTRGIKFAEAGMLLVFLLGLTVYLGVHLSSRGGGAGATASLIVEDTAPATTVEPDPRTAVLATDTLEVFADEPDPVLVSDAIIYDETVSPSQIYLDGEQAWFARDFVEAADIFTIYTDRNPGNAWGHYMLGMSLWRTGANADAAEALQAALEIKPDHLKSLLNLARIELERNDATAALVLVERAVTAAPGEAEAWRMLGRVQHNLQNTDAAIAAYEDALRLDVDDAWSLNNLGLIMIESGRSEDALAPLARAAILDPQNLPVCNNLGIALERSGYVDDAVDAYQAALEIDPAYAKAIASLARVEALAGASDQPRVDLAALAQSFQVTPRVTVSADLAVADITE